MQREQPTRREFIHTGVAALGAAGMMAGSGRAEAEEQGMKLRFGLNLLVYTAAFSKDQIGLIPKVAEMGYDGVEIPFNDLSLLDAPAVRKAREQAGIGLSACVVMIPGTSPIGRDPAERAASIARLKQVVDLTAEMGGDTVGGPLYAPVRELTGRARTDDEWKWGVDALRAGAEHAEKAGIVLAIEPLNRFETYFLNTAADTVRFVNAVDHPSIKVQVDTFHANIEEKDTAAAIRATGPLLGHFHASESDRGVPGTGQVRWDACFAALRETGYTGWVTIESFAMGIVDLCAAACIWRPLYESADDLARNGLAYLKSQATA